VLDYRLLALKLQQVLLLVTLLVLDCRLPVVPVVTAASAAMVDVSADWLLALPLAQGSNLSFNQAPASYSLCCTPALTNIYFVNWWSWFWSFVNSRSNRICSRLGPAIPGSEELFTQQVPIESVNLATGARETAMSTVPKTSSVLPSDVTGLGSRPTPGSALTGAERSLLVIKQLEI
jgi:hypothetical protein